MDGPKKGKKENYVNSMKTGLTSYLFVQCANT